MDCLEDFTDEEIKEALAIAEKKGYLGQ